MSKDTKNINGFIFKESESKPKNWTLTEVQQFETNKGTFGAKAIETKYGLKVLVTYTSPRGKQFEKWFTASNQDAEPGDIAVANLKICTYKWTGPSDEEPESTTMTRAKW